MKSINFCNEKRHFAIKNTLFVTKNLISIIHKANFANVVHPAFFESRAADA